MGMIILAFIWGLSEATFFFIVPDVLITFLALQGFGIGMSAIGAALVGALLGGSIMYASAAARFRNTYAFVTNIPTVGHKMLRQVEASLTEKGIVAMITGPIRGIPYKAYAIFAPRTNIHFGAFFLASIPARFIRFFLTGLIAWGVGNKVFPHLPEWAIYSIWAIVWIIVYIIYFKAHPWKGDTDST